MKPYYNEETNTYIFSENNRLIDIKIDFDLNIECNIKARDIKSRDINACDIKAWNIKANNISFNAVCFAYEYFKCNSIKGTRKNSRYFCLDSDVIIKSKNI